MTITSMDCYFEGRRQLSGIDPRAAPISATGAVFRAEMIPIARAGLEAYDFCRHPNAAVKMAAAYEAMKREEARAPELIPGGVLNGMSA